MALIEVSLLVGLVVLTYVLWTILRRRFKLKLNCWFCNENSMIDYKQRNWWYCNACDQYNGFSKDGDYNREIPEQKYERLNVASVLKGRNWLKPEPDLTSGLGNHVWSENGLCKICNENQALKVRLLANFVPSSEAKFDTEIDQYKERLEKVYGLCSSCQRVVKGLF